MIFFFEFPFLVDLPILKPLIYNNSKKRAE